MLHKPGSELSDTGSGYEEMKDWVIKEHEMPLQTVILGTGSYLPGDVIPNSWFRDHTFYKPDGTRIEKPTQEIIDKLRDISGIVERRYLEEDLDAAEAGARAGRAALEDSAAGQASALQSALAIAAYGQPELGRLAQDGCNPNDYRGS